jgi:hypothetical protein
MKEKVYKLLLWVGIFASGVCASCTDYVNVKPAVVVPDSVMFSKNIIPIFNTSCNKSGCHSQGGQTPDLTAPNAHTSLIYFGYVDVDVPESSIIYQKITTGSMKSNATDQDRALILEWIKEGALDN